MIIVDLSLVEVAYADLHTVPGKAANLCRAVLNPDREGTQPFSNTVAALLFRDTAAKIEPA